MIYNPPIGGIYHLYTTYSPCLLGDCIYHRSHLLRGTIETAVDHWFLGPTLALKGSSKLAIFCIDGVVREGTFLDLYGKKNHPIIVWLVVEPTQLKNMLVKLDHFPKVRGENTKYLKPPPSCPLKSNNN